MTLRIIIIMKMKYIHKMNTVQKVDWRGFLI